MTGAPQVLPSTWGVPTDPDGAFVDGPGLLVAGREGGDLEGVRLAVKDLIDVAGRTTGAGNPTFAAMARPAARSATVVEQLVAGGADVVGRTVTDELAYSLSGTNVHLGTPRNAAWPGHEPGGSSSGSAAAVASGAADLGLGTDTGGSIRVPASHCRLVGWRPTHGLLPMDGVLPLAPSFDVVGLLVRSGEIDLLAHAATALGVPTAPGATVRGVLVAEELLALLADEDAATVVAGAARLAQRHGVVRRTATVVPGHPSDVVSAFRALQGAEAWRAHGATVSLGLDLGPGVAGRFAAASAVTDAEVVAARARRDEVAAALATATADGWLVVAPAAAGPPAALGDTDLAAKDRRRLVTLAVTAPAGLAGAPVVVVPGRPAGAPPLGIAVVGARGSDRMLLDAVAGWSA